MSDDEFRKKIIGRVEWIIFFLFLLTLNTCGIKPRSMTGIESRLDEIAKIVTTVAVHQDLKQ